MTAPALILTPTLTQGHTLDWSPGTTYQENMDVIDRGGLWRCVVENKNSQPISGNTNWALVGGTPYVVVVVDPVGLTTAPFFDSAQTGPGLVIIPAPGPGLWLEMLGQVVLTATDGDDWGDEGAVAFGYGDATQRINSTGSGPLQVSGSGLYVGVSDVVGASNLITALSQYVDQPIVAWTRDDVTAGGTIFGTRSLVFYVLYRINASPAVSQPSTFFAISAVNQGTKTFTVNSDATGLGATFLVVGSTGNNRLYTKVSATYFGTPRAITAVNQGTKTFTVVGDQTVEFLPGLSATVAGSTGNDGTYTIFSNSFGGGNTNIVVVEAIPDATADGTIAGPNQTDVITVNAIPDATADGWIKVV